MENPMPRISFNGRVLFLSADPDVMDAQISGHDIDLAEAGEFAPVVMDGECSA